MSDPRSRYASLQTESGVCVVTILTPEIRDPQTAYGVRDEVIQLLAAADHSRIVLDLTNVRFVGSVGFLAFLGIRRQFPDARIVLCGMAKSILEVFSVCKLVSTDPGHRGPFEVAATPAAAMKSLET